MGVRIREELRQAIKLNNASADTKNTMHKDKMAHTRSTNVDSAAAQHSNVEQIAASESEYPLLKPITFTNLMVDDYLESGVWNLK